MRKLLITLGLFSVVPAVFATTTTTSVSESANAYAPFQQFDRQYSLGVGATSGNLTNGQNGQVNNSEYVNLEIERLFNVGVWLDINANLLTYYSQAVDPAVTVTGNTTGSQANFGGINVKVGYAFPIYEDKLLLTPYGTIGRNTNISSYTMAYNSVPANNNYTYTTTLGSKFNVYRNLQLGAQAFYTNYYFTNSLTTPSYGNALVPQSSVGGLISVGLTY